MARPVTHGPRPARWRPTRWRDLATRAVIGVGLAWSLVLSLPVLAAGLATPVAAHSQLLLSLPAAGSVLPVGPTQISLVFSEPIDAGYTSLDILDSTGTPILTGAGMPSPTDPEVLTVSLPAPLPAGSYTVNWRASSAADGHDTTGFLVFGVGSVSLSGTAQSPTGNGSLHSGQDTAHAAAEVQGKTAADGGAMVAFGLVILAVLVLAPALGHAPRGTAYGAAIALVVAAGGCLVLIVVGATASITSSAAQPDYLAYATTSRAGVVLSARLLLAMLAGAAVLVLARRNRVQVALVVGGLSGALEIGLMATTSHAAAFSSPLPVVVDTVHVGSASIWLAGIVSLAALTDFGGRSRVAAEVLRNAVQRFSALALVSVALISATGIYAAWIEIGDFTAIRSAYDLDLAIKVGVFVLALGIGALNYFDGGQGRSWLGGLSKRLLLEMCLAVAVVVIAANLTSGSPTGADRPVAIAPAHGNQPTVGFAVQPGRPGPTRYIATLPAAPASGEVLTLDMTRTDGGPGSTSLAMAEDPADPGGPTQIADVDQLPPDSSWTATLVLREGGGVETGRESFAFAVDDTGISAGLATPPIDPLVVVALLLLLGALLGTGLSLSGRSLPRTLPETSRVAVLGGSLVGALLGIAILVGGPPR